MVWIFLCAALLIGQQASALGNEVAGDHLLRLYDNQQLEDGRLVEDEILIFRDGATVQLRTVGRHLRVFRGDAQDEEIDELKRALVADGIDALAGDCDLRDIPRVLSGPLGLRSRSTWLSWFGVGGRRARHLELGHEGSESGRFGSDCSEALQRIGTAAFGYAQAVLAGPNATNGPDELYPRSLLFSVDGDLRSDPVCRLYAFDENVYLFRDGLLLHHFLDSDGGFAYTRAQIPRETRQRLNEILVEARIGRIDTTCRTWFFLPFAIDGGCLDYSWKSTATWHGREGRRGTIDGNDVIEQRCTSSVIRVRMELMRLMLAAVTDSAAATVSGTFSSP